MGAGFRPKLVVAAKVLVYINGRLFGRCTSFQWTSRTPRRKIHVIDIQHPVELGATTVDVDWSMGVLRVIGDGGLQGAGVVAQQTDLSREKYFSLALVERSTGATIFKADLCATDSESWSVVAKDRMLGQANGSGIVWVNEVGTTIF